MTTADRIYVHMRTVHGGIYEPDPPPRPPVPAPAPTPAAAPMPTRGANAYNAPLYGQRVRAPPDDEENPTNPFLGVDYREQQELLRQAALNLERTQAVRRMPQVAAIPAGHPRTLAELAAIPPPRAALPPPPGATQPVARPVAQPVVRPVATPAARPIVAQPAVRPVAQPMVRQVVHTVPAPIPRPVVAQPVVRPIAQQYNPPYTHQPVPQCPSYGTVPHQPVRRHTENRNDGCCCVVM